MNRVAIVAIPTLLALAGTALAGIEIHANLTLPTGETHTFDAWANETGEANASVDSGPATTLPETPVPLPGAPEIPSVPTLPAPQPPALPEIPGTPELPGAPEIPVVPPEIPTIPEVPSAPEAPAPEIPTLPETPTPPEAPSAPADPTQVVDDALALVQGTLDALPAPSLP